MLARATNLSTLGNHPDIRYGSRMSTQGKTGGQKNAHARTRRDHATELAEDYVEAIADIIQQKQQCRVVDLARRFDVSHVTVSRIIKRLQSEQLLITEPYRPIVLTDKGRKLARQSRLRHEIVYQFLLAIGVDETVASIDSEGIEHHVSPQTLKAMESFVSRSKPSSA